MDPREAPGFNARRREPGDALAVRFPAPDGANVSGTTFQRRGNRRVIELRIVGQDDDIGRAVHGQVLQHRVGPSVDHLAGLWESLAVGEFRPRIDHRDAETEGVGEAGQRDRDMGSSEDEELRRSREGLEKNAIATNWILLLEQLGRSGIGGREQLTGAGPGADIGLQHHRSLGFQGADQLAMDVGERLDQNVHLAAAAQADRPGEVIAHAVVKQAGRLAFEDGLRLLENLPFETPAADRAGDLS